jgi:hypothetical protein
MRIGTWNLEAKWTNRHADVLISADCDVWLLTEVDSRTALPGYAARLSTARMSVGQHYAGVFARRPMEPLPDPHPASAAARIDGIIYCASVLPWAAKDDLGVWGEGNQGERTSTAVRVLERDLRPGATVWGGDFNHALSGATRWSGSAAGRRAITESAAALGIDVPTATLPHRRPGICSIDHVGVPRSWSVTEATRVPVAVALSDHDAYVVTADPG